MSTNATDVGPSGREIRVQGETGVALDHHAQQHTPAAPAENEASALVRLAIDKGVSVDVIERLVGLQERVADRHARAAYIEALAAFQEECPEITKSKTAKITPQNGAPFSYSYAPLDVVARTIRPYLKKHGLSYNFTVDQNGNNLIISCVVRHIDGHSESASFPVPIDKGRMSAAQSNGSALTYGKRQALVAAFGLTTADVDNDGKGERGDDSVKITAEDVAALDDLIEANGRDRQKFLIWMGYESLSDIPQHELERARKALQGRAAR